MIKLVMALHGGFGHVRGRLVDDPGTASFPLLWSLGVLQHEWFNYRACPVGSNRQPRPRSGSSMAPEVPCRFYLANSVMMSVTTRAEGFLSEGWDGYVLNYVRA